MPMTSPFKKYYVTLSKDTLSYSRTQHSKVSSTDGLTLMWVEIVIVLFIFSNQQSRNMKHVHTNIHEHRKWKKRIYNILIYNLVDIE